MTPAGRAVVGEMVAWGVGGVVAALILIGLHLFNHV